MWAEKKKENAMTRQTRAPLRLGADGLRSLLGDARAAAATRRAEWLAQHTDYVECVVAGCTGVVGPNFIRRTPRGDRYGLCPRREQHHRLFPAIFDAPLAQPRRRPNAA